MNDGDGIILLIVRHLHTLRPSIQVEDVINVRQNFYNAVAMQRYNKHLGSEKNHHRYHLSTLE